MKEYIMAIESLVSGFSIIETNRCVKFSFQFNSNSNIFSVLEPNDVILIYYKNDISAITTEMVLVEKEDTNIVLKKIYEFSKGVPIENLELKEKVVNQNLVEIDYNQYSNFKEQLYIGNYTDRTNRLEDDESLVATDLTKKRVTGGTNIILYGVPGSGKSWTIKNEYDIDNVCMERLVFHPDYSYSDFIGQILPKIANDGSVSYEFVPGPFTRILRKSYFNPGKKYYLVIEEVNRGNAPAIFGDVFQLLDRNENGESEYEITNADIARCVYLDENHKVRIPSNMTILCTMNTSDQNVFTLDTAFQRRWSMRLINNKFRNDPIEQRFASSKILDTSITWEKFCTEINKIILSKNIRMTSSEDKRLGTHFVIADDLRFEENNKIQNSKFPEKVLKYLWDDAFKFDREDIFDLNNFQSLEELIDFFVNSIADSRFNVFKDNIRNTFFGAMGE